MPNITYKETLISAQGDGSALVAAAAASALPAQAKATLGAGYLRFIGQTLTIRATGRQSVAVTTPGTIAWSVKFGGSVFVFDGLAMALDTAGYTNVGFWLEILLTLRIVGTAAQLFGQAKYSSPVLAGNPATPPKGSLTALLPWNSAPALGTAFDSTVAQTVDLFYTPSLGTASMTLHQYELIADN